MQASDVFVDVGSGPGRAAALVHLMTGARVIGLEIQPALVAAARDMTARLRLPDVAFVEGDAPQLTAALSAGSVFLLYCPFSGERLAAAARDARDARPHAHDPRLLRRPPAAALRLAHAAAAAGVRPDDLSQQPDLASGRFVSLRGRDVQDLSGELHGMASGVQDALRRHGGAPFTSHDTANASRAMASSQKICLRCNALTAAHTTQTSMTTPHVR